MKTLPLFEAGAAAGLALGLAGAAAAADTPPAQKGHDNCFRSSDWDGWHAPNDKTLYLRVRLHDIYQVDLNSPSSMLTWPDTHLVNVIRGSNYICSPLDLQLTVTQNNSSAREPLFLKTITKLTPEQIAAIPKKDLP